MGINTLRRGYHSESKGRGGRGMDLMVHLNTSPHKGESPSCSNDRGTGKVSNKSKQPSRRCREGEV